MHRIAIVGHTIKKTVLFLLFLNFSTCLYADFFDPSIEATENRIAPIGKVRIKAEIIPQPPFRNAQGHLGKLVFDKHCSLCHSSGVAGAPRFGNKEDWKLRIKKSFSILLKHVQDGYHAMPPRGTCMECSPTDLEAATRYVTGKLH